MIALIINLLTVVLFVTLFLSTPVLLETVYAIGNDGFFTDDFNGSSIDGKKWEISNLVSGKRWCLDHVATDYSSPGKWFDLATESCHDAPQNLPLGNVNVSNGEATFASGMNRASPFIWSGTPNLSIFPDAGDFVFEIRMKYPSVGSYGTGVSVMQSNDWTPIGSSPMRIDPKNTIFSAWTAISTGFVISNLGRSTIVNNPSTYHTFRLEYKDGKYTVFVDDVLTLDSIESNLRPNSILVGNREYASWDIADWSDFTVDYIKITKPAPPGLQPFLELPFDYKSKGKSFDQVALNPESWFDHEYPLQNVSCCIYSIVPFNYKGIKVVHPYHSHSGYDYSAKNGVEYLTPVLAGYSGYATFVPTEKSGGGGNEIKIDHGNGYQTWYEHLDWNSNLANHGLVVDTEGEKVFVNKGQEIGKTGYSGNIIPQNKFGAHIHLSVFKDENNNGTFDDDYPYGLVDPLGWEGKDKNGLPIVDPWTVWTQDPMEKIDKRYGAESVNLFIDRTKLTKSGILTSGGSAGIDNVQINVPPNAYPTFFTLNANSSSYESQENLTSVMPSLVLDATDNLGQAVTQFFEPVQILYSYAKADLTNIKESTLKLYFFNTSTNKWEALPSTVDTTNKTVSATTTHFTHFALMGEIKDQIAPTTAVVIRGDKGDTDWYRTSTSVDLQAVDNDGGVGVKETLYTINGIDWFTYTTPVNFSSEGDYKMTFQSIDLVGNLEDQKSVSFHIDKTPPEAQISYDLTTFDSKIVGKDSSESATVTIDNTSPIHPKFVISDKAGNKLFINTDKIKLGKQVALSIKSLQYNGGSVLLLDNNIFFTLAVTDRNNSVKQLDQYYSLKDDKKIFTSYSSGPNSTKIYTRTPGTTIYTQETHSGIILLELETEKGKLKYKNNI